MKRLSEETGLGERAVRYAIKALIGAGGLAKEDRRRPDGTRATDRYLLLILGEQVEINAAGQQAADSAGSGASTSGKILHQPVADSAGLTSFEPTNRRTVNARASDFDFFWRIYPRKVGKLAAKRAFEKALKGGAVAAELVAAVERARWPGDVQFIPHPATWLNQGRWMDAPPMAQRVGFV